MRTRLFLGTVAMCMAAATMSHAETLRFTAHLTGSSEVPPNTSAGAGDVDATLNTADDQFSYTITYKDLTGPAVAAHFHGPAAPGVNAPPIITVAPLESPMKGTATLTAAQKTDLTSGKWYFNIHTAAHPGGEIRGQLAQAR